MNSPKPPSFVFANWRWLRSQCLTLLCLLLFSGCANPSPQLSRPDELPTRPISQCREARYQAVIFAERSASPADPQLAQIIERAARDIVENRGYILLRGRLAPGEASRPGLAAQRVETVRRRLIATGIPNAIIWTATQPDPAATYAPEPRNNPAPLHRVDLILTDAGDACERSFANTTLRWVTENCFPPADQLAATRCRAALRSLER